MSLTKQDLIDFESSIKDLWEDGELPSLIHLSGGNEDQLLEIYEDILPCDWVFSTHRNHYHALLKGIPPETLRESIRRGRSMFIYDAGRHFACSAVLAGTCAIAAGVAWSLKEEGSEAKVICFIGDGGEEEGHFYEAAMYVEAQGLPCQFIIEDNDRSVDTLKSFRRRGCSGLDEVFKCVRRYHYKSTYPHAGSGCSFQITFKPASIEAHKRSVRLTSASDDSRCDFMPDDFGKVVNRPYAGDCLPGHKDYRKAWEAIEKAGPIIESSFDKIIDGK